MDRQHLNLEPQNVNTTLLIPISTRVSYITRAKSAGCTLLVTLVFLISLTVNLVLVGLLYMFLSGHLHINIKPLTFNTSTTGNSDLVSTTGPLILPSTKRKHLDSLAYLINKMSDEYKRYISNNNEQSERLIKGVNLYMDYTETRKGYGFIKWKPSENRSNLKNVYGNTNRSAEFRKNAVKINNDGFYSVYISLTYKVKDIIDSKEISVTCHLQRTRDWNVLFNQTLKVSSKKLNSFETFFFVNSYKLQTDDLISIHVTNIDSILYNSSKSTVFGVYKIS